MRPLDVTPLMSLTAMTDGPHPTSAAGPAQDPCRSAHRTAIPRDVPETRFLTRYAAGPERWDTRVVGLTADGSRHRIPLGTPEAGSLISHPADAAARTVLAPVDPIAILLRHRAEVERLRIAFGHRRLFEGHLMPLLAGWAAMVQSLPRDERGLWSGADGLFEAGIAFATGALNTIDARIPVPDMAPQARSEWTDRLRVAAVIAGCLSDAAKLAQLKLEAGSDARDDAHFEPHTQFNPSEETVLAFAVGQMGRVMRLTRYTPEMAAGRLPTLAADLLRLVVPAETLKWLGAAQRADGETVLSALKAAVTYASGLTETESQLSEAVARGREWAINRRAAAAARREGTSPLLAGFAAIFALEVRERLLSGRWPLNEGDSPVLWSDDGLMLAWPRAFTEITASNDSDWRLRDVPDEERTAAEILAANGFAMRCDAGSPVWLTPDDAVVGRGAWLRVVESQAMAALARRAAERAGKTLPARLPPIFSTPAAAGRHEDTRAGALLHPTFARRIEWPDNVPTRARRVLDEALSRLNHTGDAKMFTHPQGAFIPETLLPDAWWEDPGAADAVLVPWTSPANPLVRVARTSWLRDVVMKGSGAVKASKYDPGRRAMSADPLRLQGVVVAAAFVRDEAL